MQLLDYAKNAPVIDAYEIGVDLYNRCLNAIKSIKTFPEVEAAWLILETEADRSDDKEYIQILVAAKEFSPQYGLRTAENITRNVKLSSSLWDAFAQPDVECMVLNYYQNVEPSPGEYLESHISDYIKDDMIRTLFIRE